MQFTPQRLDRVHRSMDKEQLDAIIVTRRQDVQYLTGYHSRANNIPVGCVLARGSQPNLIISDTQVGEKTADSVMAKMWPFSFESEENWFRVQGSVFWDKVQAVIKNLGLERGMLGLQHDWVSIRGFDRLKSLLPQAGFKDFSQPLWRLRHLKDPAEIEAIRQAVNIAEIGVRTALETVSSGKSEEDASLEIESAMRVAGGQLRGIRAAVLSGGHARFPFAQPGSRRVGVDELVVLDITVSQSGYFAEVARTIHLGHPSDRQKKTFKSLLETAELIQRSMKPEVQIQDLVANVMKKIGKKLPQEAITQPLGSSIGLDLREPPYLSQGSQYSLRAGMVLTIHPTVYFENVGCSKIADVVRITEGGCELLGSLSRETL